MTSKVPVSLLLLTTEMAPTGTHTEINVSTVNHKNLIGNYTTHVYVDYVDNTVDGFNLGETALAPRNRRL